MLRIHCTSCGNEVVRALDWCIRHASLPCDGCGGFIDLTTDENLGAIRHAHLTLNRQADQG